MQLPSMLDWNRIVVCQMTDIAYPRFSTSLAASAIDMQVEVVSRGSLNGAVIGRSKVESLYWSPRQIVAHIASACSALRTGDLMATGTVSGPDEGT